MLGRRRFNRIFTAPNPCYLMQPARCTVPMKDTLKVTLENDNDRFHIIKFSKTKLSTFTWEVLSHLLLPTDVAPSANYLFGSMAQHMVEQYFAECSRVSGLSHMTFMSDY